MIASLVRPEIMAMDEINWGEVPEGTPFRLLWGENQQVFDGYEDAIVSEIKNINLYPSATKQTLRQRIATYSGVQPDNIVATNGSDEALELIAKVFLNPGDEVIVPMPSYPCFDSVSQMMGARIRKVALESDFTLDLEKLIASVTPRTKVIWLANPNNPTGNVLLLAKQIEQLAKATKCIIVCDECYFELSGVTAAGLVERYPRIIVTRSFSKVFALAGARLGCIIANKQVVRYLNRLQQTNQVFNVNRFAQAAGIAILSDPARAKKYCQAFVKAKKRFESLLAETGLTAMSTKTTFCLAKLPSGVSSKTFKGALAKKGVLIKDCSIYDGLGEEYICLGVPAQNVKQQCATIISSTIKELL